MTEDVKHTLAWDLLTMMKKDNNILKLLLGLSIIANIILIIFK